MFDKIWEEIKDNGKIHEMRNIVFHISDVIENIECAFDEHPDSKDAIIDVICKILQSYKD